MADSVRDEERAELRRLAAITVGGPWRAELESEDEGGYWDVRAGDGSEVTPHAYICTASREDAEYIAAANPAVILALLADLDRLTREKQECMAEHDGYFCTLRPGHEGDHKAYKIEFCASWPAAARASSPLEPTT